MTTPHAVHAIFQHVLDTYVSETEKTAATWRQFSTVDETMTQQLLWERQFFSEFLGTQEPAADSILPDPLTVETAARRLTQLTARRLPFLAAQSEEWWLTRVSFRNMERERIWIFWQGMLQWADERARLGSVLQ